MFIDGRSLPDGERLLTDLCIIGCGPAGLTVATELGGSGVRVTVLESGGPARDRAADRLGRGDSVGHPYMALETSRARGIGGTSLHWQMHRSGGDEGWIARPLDPLDFESRPGIPDSGWPFTYAELEPHYRRAQERCGLGPWGYRPDDWATDRARPFDLPADRVVTNVFQRGARRFSENAHVTAASGLVDVIHHATVVGLVPGGSGTRLDSVVAATSDGRRITVAARRFVLAAGGIENPRLLLGAGPAERGSGIGNEHGLVGRYFMERLSARAGVLVPSGRDIVAAAGFYDSHLVDGTRVHGVLSLAPAVVRGEGLRNGAFWLRGRPLAATAPGVGSALTLYRIATRSPFAAGLIWPNVRALARDLPSVARTAAHHALRRPEREPEAFQVGVQAEQAPNPESRVTLSARRDRFGLPLATLAWRPTDDDRRSIARSVARLDEALRIAGIGRIEHPFGSERSQPLFIGNWHHMGGTRMHSDPAHGVVDPSGRIHGMENLYVAGSSVFPTSGFANPTLTIVALALRMADQLRAERWGDGPS